MSSGIGEYLDLIPVIDWCAEVGLDVIQLLPLNDSGTETSPFSALSAFALDPKYLSLQALPSCETNMPTYPSYSIVYAPSMERSISSTKKSMSLSKCSCGSISPTNSKPSYQRQVIYSFWNINPGSKGFAFLKPLKVAISGRAGKLGPQKSATLPPPFLLKLSQQYQSEVQYHQIIQYLCFQQLRQVREHAESKKIWLKGDIPILINRESADVWLYRGLFSR